MNRLGVCSWSLRPSSARELAERVREAGLSAVQLALDPIREGAAGWDEGEARRELDRAGIRVLSGMMTTIGEDYSTLETIRETGGIRPDKQWGANLANARAIAAIAQRMGLGLVTFHAGFLPHEVGVAEARERATMLERLRTLADVFGERGVSLGLETGQESAETLLDALAELGHANIGVNFDPANMILYGMGDPVASLRALSPHVVQIHVKDAKATKVPGTWGQEVAVGDGDVDWAAFFGVVRDENLRVDLVLEREACESRVLDVRQGRERIERVLASSDM